MAGACRTSEIPAEASRLRLVARADRGDEETRTYEFDDLSVKVQLTMTLITGHYQQTKVLSGSTVKLYFPQSFLLLPHFYRYFTEACAEQPITPPLSCTDMNTMLTGEILLVSP